MGKYNKLKENIKSKIGNTKTNGLQIFQEQYTYFFQNPKQQNGQKNHPNQVKKTQVPIYQKPTP